jgi:ribonuclease P protein component
MRESFRLNQQRLPGTDIVFMVRPGILRLSHSQIFARLDSHWQKIISKCAN